MLDAARAVLPAIAREREAIDRNGALPATLVDALRAAGLFELWLPAALGGPELSPAELVRVIEVLASGDGSVGWCAAVAATLSVLGGSLTPDVARAVFGDHGVVAGAFRPRGRAVAVSGGYRVTGRWAYGSGILHSRFVAVHCTVADGMRFAIVPTASLEIVRGWNVSGLRGTGSHDFRIDDVFVADDYMLPAWAAAPREPGPLYRFPLLALSTVSLAAVALGIARSAVDALVALAAKVPTGTSVPLRDNARAQYAAGRADALHTAARAGLHAAVARAWEIVAAGGILANADRMAVRVACAFAAEACAEAVDLVYRAAGGNAIDEAGTIARCFRDVHAATQHIGLAADNYEHAGKLLFGHDGGTQL